MIDALSSTPVTPASPANDRDAKLKSAAQAFEAVFVRQMIASMRSATPSEDIFGSSASGQFRDMSDARLADDMAAKGSFGIADMLLKQFGGKESAPPAVNVKE